MDYEKIVRAVRCCGSSPSSVECLGSCVFYNGGDMDKCIPAMTKAAGDAIERLMKELEMARAERDVVTKAMIRKETE